MEISEERLAATEAPEDEMNGRQLLDRVFSKCASVLQLSTAEHEPLCIRRDAFFLLNFRLEGFHVVALAQVDSDSLSCDRPDKDLDHLSVQSNK